MSLCFLIFFLLTVTLMLAYILYPVFLLKLCQHFIFCHFLIFFLLTVTLMLAYILYPVFLFNFASILYFAISLIHILHNMDIPSSSCTKSCPDSFTTDIFPIFRKIYRIPELLIFCNSRFTVARLCTSFMMPNTVF